MRHKFGFAALLALVVAGFSAPTLAAQCKDAKGKFVKCPVAAASTGARCKNSAGKFAKCGTPGAIVIK
jgi:hypothetical protein